MCLATLTRKKITANFGWKVFRKEGNSITNCLTSTDEFKCFPISFWVNEKDYRRHISHIHDNYNLDRIIITNKRSYKKGFHIYLNKEDAIDACFDWETVRKVYFKDVVAKGKQKTNNKGYTVVVKNMKVTSWRG